MRFTARAGAVRKNVALYASSEAICWLMERMYSIAKCACILYGRRALCIMHIAPIIKKINTLTTEAFARSAGAPLKIFAAFVISASSACAGLSIADLASLNEDSVDSLPFVGVLSAQSAEEIGGGCMGIKQSVLGKIPKDEKGVKAVSKICEHINKAPCQKEEACVERCKGSCKEDAAQKVL